MQCVYGKCQRKQLAPVQDSQQLVFCFRPSLCVSNLRRHVQSALCSLILSASSVHDSFVFSSTVQPAQSPALTSRLAKRERGSGQPAPVALCLTHDPLPPCLTNDPAVTPYLPLDPAPPRLTHGTAHPCQPQTQSTLLPIFTPHAHMSPILCTHASRTPHAHLPAPHPQNTDHMWLVPNPTPTCGPTLLRCPVCPMGP